MFTDLIRNMECVELKGRLNFGNIFKKGSQVEGTASQDFHNLEETVACSKHSVDMMSTWKFY